MTRTLLVLAGILLALPAASREFDTVRIGTEGTYPPFSYLDENNRFVGFEIEIANALCARMKVRCRFMREDWNDMIPALLASRFDAIVSSMSITAERRKQVAFTNRYYQSPASFVARKASNIRDTSPAAMKGRVVGGQRGSIHADYLQKVYAPAGVVVKLYASQQEAQFDLARGQLDALLADKVGLHEWLTKSQQGSCCAFAGEEVRDPAYIGDGIGIALRKEDDDLREKFNRALDSILADGTYKKINDKYFPFSVY